MIVLCDRMNTESSWSEGDCYNHLKAYDSCKSEFIDVFTCILDPPDFCWTTNEEIHELMHKRCSSDYSSSRECTEKNGCIMTAEDFCDTNKFACVYDEEQQIKNAS